jgi:hypothetical protein
MTTLSSVQTSKLNRKKLQDLAKKYGIKANLKTELLKRLLKTVQSGRKIPIRFLKKTWLQNNKDYIFGGLSVISLVVSVGCLITLLKFKSKLSN